MFMFVSCLISHYSDDVDRCVLKEVGVLCTWIKLMCCKAFTQKQTLSGTLMVYLEACCRNIHCVSLPRPLLCTFSRDSLAGIQVLGEAHSTSWDLALP